MTATVFYGVLIACYCLTLNVQASDSLRCQSVQAAIKMNSSWTVVYTQKIISWRRPADSSTVVNPCYVSLSIRPYTILDFVGPQIRATPMPQRHNLSNLHVLRNLH